MSYLSHAVGVSLSALASCLLPLAASAQVPTLINYQGRLVNGTNLVNGNVGLSLRLFNVASGGTKLYEDSNTVSVADGLYSTFIGDHPTNASFLVALTNAAVWVEVAVNGTTLSPRERLASVGYSLRTRGLTVSTNGSVVLNAADGGSLVRESVTYAAIGGGFQNGIDSGADAATIAGGYANAIYSNSYASSIGGGNLNYILQKAEHAAIAGGYQVMVSSGSYGSVIGGGEYNVIGEKAPVSTVAGGTFNNVGGASSGSTIGGGVQNVILSNSPYSSIGGGRNNEIGSSATNATIGGGEQNAIGENARYAFVGGGRYNSIEANSAISAIVGGYANVIAPGASYSAILGGYSNNIRTNASLSMIVGGGHNEVGAGAENAFAAGWRAKARHTGAFVWADNGVSDFASTSTNQFLVRANGGVGINTNNPGAALHVAGEAMIGSAGTPARFGMAAVRRTASGNLFVHPADTNLVLTWDSVNRVLSITNTAIAYYDCQMQMIPEGATVPTARSDDITSSGFNYLRLTNSAADSVGWSATATREAAGPSFQFNGTGFDNIIAGLVIYWY